MTTTLVIAPEISPGFIRAVLFEHGIDDWVDRGPDPLRRRYAGDTYAQQLTATYNAWKWLCDQTGADIDTAPAETGMPAPLASAVAAADWTELVTVLFTVTRAQAHLLAGVIARGDDDTRRAFDRSVRDYLGQAALGFWELQRGDFVDGTRAQARLDELIPATHAWLVEAAGAGPGTPAAAWSAQLSPLLEALGRPNPLG